MGLEGLIALFHWGMFQEVFFSLFVFHVPDKGGYTMEGCY